MPMYPQRSSVRPHDVMSVYGVITYSEYHSGRAVRIGLVLPHKVITYSVVQWACGAKESWLTI